MRVTAVSDLHGHIPPDLEPGDLLIVAGDLTASDKLHQYFQVFDWIDRQPFNKKILVAGNHDMEMSREAYAGPVGGQFIYLCNSGTTYENLKIWGSPDSLLFDGINPHCTAFSGKEEDLNASYSLIPDDIDIIISHGPAKYVLDRTRDGRYVGSFALRHALERVKPKLLITGHIHGDYGIMVFKHPERDTYCINASIMNDDYEPVNEPITIVLQDGNPQLPRANRQSSSDCTV